MSEFLFDFEDFRSSEEIQHLNESIVECQKIQEELKSSIKCLKRISSPAKSYLEKFTPATTWTEPKPGHSTCCDVLINEACQKHDYDSPQQHHKVQEINDASDYTGTSTEEDVVINHRLEINESSESCFDGADEDGNSLTHAESSCEKSSTSVDFLCRHKFTVELIKLKKELESSIRCLQRFTIISNVRAIQSSNYDFKRGLGVSKMYHFKASHPCRLLVIPSEVHSRLNNLTDQFRIKPFAIKEIIEC